MLLHPGLQSPHRLSIVDNCRGTATSALIYGVVPMVEMAHMVVAGSWTILAPGLFVASSASWGGRGEEENIEQTRC